MGATLTDFVIEGIIRDGIAEIRADPSRLDDIFSEFKEPHLATLYGAKAINDIKKYILANKISIVQSWLQVGASVPCYSIQLLGTDEDNQRAFIGDFAGIEEESIERAEILQSSAPYSYNHVTGYILADDTVDAALINIGHIFIDGAGSEFLVVGGIDNATGQKRFNIGPGQTVNTTGTFHIVSSIDFVRYIVKKIHINEQIMVGIHTAGDPNLGKYLYHMLVYILASNKMKFDPRRMQLLSFSASDFNQASEYLPEQIYTRFVTLRTFSEMSWRSRAEVIADSGEYKLRVPKDRVGRRDEDVLTIGTEKSD